MKYSMVIGRFQCLPPHEGHTGIINKLLEEGKNVLVCIRDTPQSDSDPYTGPQRQHEFEKIYGDNNKVKIIIIPDIEEVVYGRKVGWGIRQIQLDAQTEAISATKIRENTKK